MMPCTCPGNDRLSGVFGYSWVAALHTFGGISLPVTLLLANMTCFAWLAILSFLLKLPGAPNLEPAAPQVTFLLERPIERHRCGPLPHMQMLPLQQTRTLPGAAPI